MVKSPALQTQHLGAFAMSNAFSVADSKDCPQCFQMMRTIVMSKQSFEKPSALYWKRHETALCEPCFAVNLLLNRNGREEHKEHNV